MQDEDSMLQHLNEKSHLLNHSMIDKHLNISSSKNQNNQQQVLYTEEWLVESTKNQTSKGINPEQFDMSLMMKSPLAESDKSIMEHKLREENMILRQEILKLKKALYMSNENSQEEQLNIVKTQEYSPMYNYNGITDTPTDSEFMNPQREVPQPYKSQPKKPEITSTLNSNFKRTQPQVLQSQEFPLNLKGRCLIYNKGEDEMLLSLNDGSSIDMRFRTKCNGNPLERESVDTFDQRKRSLQMLESFENPILLRMNNQESTILNKSTDINEVNSIYRSRITNDDSRELKQLEHLIQREKIHIRKDFLEDDNPEGFEEKKRKSSVFELKRHYEQEIENLKKDLQLMQSEEQKLKTRLEKQNFPLSKEFTFKSENDKALFNQQVSTLTEQYPNKVKADQKEDQRKSQTYQREKKTSIDHKQSRIPRLSKHSFGQQDNVMIEPPSFSNSNINTKQNSPLVNLSKHRLPQIKEYQECQKITEDDYEDQRLDTDVIDQIFEDKDMMCGFKCLDSFQQQQDDNQDPQSLRESKDDQDGNYIMNQYLDNSFCQMNYNSGQSSVAVVRAQERVRNDQRQDLFQSNQILQSNGPVAILVESPKSKPQDIRKSQLSKDYSPSFGGKKQCAKNAFDTYQNSLVKSLKNFSAYKKAQKSNYHSRKSSHSFVNNSVIDQSHNFSQVSRSPQLSRPESKVSSVIRDKRQDKHIKDLKNQYTTHKSCHQKKGSISVVSNTQKTFLRDHDAYNTCGNQQQRKLVQSRSQLDLQPPTDYKLSRQDYSRAIPHNQSVIEMQHSPYQKDCTLNKSQLSQSNLGHYENFHSNCEIVDPDFWYDYKHKSALKKRTEILKQKENIHREKLNQKLAKIEALQKQKEEKRNQIIEKRYNKSPLGIAFHPNQSVINTNHDQSCSVISYIQVPKDHSNSRTPQPNTPSAMGQTRNDQFGTQAFSSLFQNYNKNQNSISRDKSKSSLSASRQTSRRVTENNTPILSSRGHYEGYMTEGMLPLNNMSCHQSSSLFESRKHSTSNNEVDLKSTFLNGNLIPSNSTFILQPKQSYNSTTSLFKRGPVQNEKQERETVSNYSSKSPLKYTQPIQEPRLMTNSSQSVLKPISSVLNQSTSYLSSKSIRKNSSSKYNTSQNISSSKSPNSYSAINQSKSYLKQSKNVNSVSSSRYGQRIVERVVKKNRLEPIIEHQ